MSAILHTAYNEDVQKYIERPNTSSKKLIIEDMKVSVQASLKSFSKLFPTGTKRYQVMDTIIYLLSGGGISKVSASTLAKKANASVRTVYSAVKALKETCLFLVGGMADGSNKYIFVYKNHADFQEILKNVFYLDEIEETTENNHSIAGQIAEQVAGQRNAESTVNKGVEGSKTNPIYNNFIISKQEKAIIKHSVEDVLIESQNDKQKEAEQIQEYCTNPYQKQIYNIITKNIGVYHPAIVEKASIIALRAGSNCTEKAFRKALNAVAKIDRALCMETEINSIPALFDKIYTDRIKYSPYYDKIKTAPKEKRDTSIYFNWLKEDGSKTAVYIQ